MAYNGRRGGSAFPNIDHLNTLPSEWDNQNVYQNVDEDLSIFTSAEFNFDMQDMNNPTFFPSGDMSQPSSAHVAQVQPPFAQHDFNFPGFNDFNSMPVPAQSVPGNGDAAISNQSMSPATSDKAGPTPRAEKRKSTVVSTAAASAAADDTKSVGDGDDDARNAAEEDKRRRNTAASARFRVKKKQREQQMEKTAKEMTDRVSSLEAKVAELESENKILRGLLTDKVGNDAAVAGLSRKFTKDESKAVKPEAAR